jgi:hypothetical protein
MSAEKKPMSPFGAELFAFANQMNRAFLDSIPHRQTIKRPSEGRCEKGHERSGDGPCPLCNPDQRKLSEFGPIGEPRTGSYDAETLFALERSHSTLVNFLRFLLAKETPLLTGLEKTTGSAILSNAYRVRRKAKLPC